eukprot:gene5940-8188_t
MIPGFIKFKPVKVINQKTKLDSEINKINTHSVPHHNIISGYKQIIDVHKNLIAIMITILPFTRIRILSTSKIDNRVYPKQTKRIIFLMISGYLIPLGYYLHIMNALNSSISSTFATKFLLFDDQELTSIHASTINDTSNTDSNEGELNKSAEIIKSVVLKEVKEGDVVCVMGHSKGGAVAALVGVKLQAFFVNTLLILLDPVDLVDLQAIRSIDKIKLMKPLNSLIISTPFGGYSKYYHSNYESACAPPQRGATIFYDKLRNLNNDLLKSSISLAESSVHNISLYTKLVTFPQVGHFQFLRNRNNLTFSSVCAEGEIKDSSFLKFLFPLMSEWILASLCNSCSNYVVNNDDKLQFLNDGNSSHVIVFDAGSSHYSIQLGS